MSLLLLEEGDRLGRAAVPRGGLDEDRAAAGLEHARELGEDARIIMHVVQRVVAKHVAEGTLGEGHRVPVAMLKGNQLGPHAKIGVDAVLQACLEIAMDVEGDDAPRHAGEQLGDPSRARAEIEHGRLGRGGVHAGGHHRKIEEQTGCRAGNAERLGNGGITQMSNPVGLSERLNMTVFA